MISAKGRWFSLPPGPAPRTAVPRDLPAFAPYPSPQRVWALGGNEPAPFASSQRLPRPAPRRAAPTRPPEPPSPREPGRRPGDNAAGPRPRAELQCAMAASPGAPRAPAVEAPPPQPDARTLDRGSVSAGRGAVGSRGCAREAAGRGAGAGVQPSEPP